MSQFTPSGSGGVPIQVVSGGSGTVRNLFGEQLGVAAGATEAVLQYTCPPGKKAYLLHLDVGGSNIATYTSDQNGDSLSRYRTGYGSPLTYSVFLGSGTTDGIPLVAGDVLTISVFNFQTYIGDFEARLQLLEV